jgi:hypothetical protein
MPPEVREMLEAASPHAAERLIQALDAEKYVGLDARAVPDWKARAVAAEALFDRLYGKPAQAITGDDGGPLKIDFLAIAEKLRKAGEGG